MVIKRWHAVGFAHLAPRTNQMRLLFDNDIKLTAFTICLITPPPLVRIIGEGRSGPHADMILLDIPNLSGMA